MISPDVGRGVRISRVAAYALVLSLIVGMFQAFPYPAPYDIFQPQPALAETLSNPKFVSAAVMPNGQVGLLYANGDNGVSVSAEIRFSRHTGEHALIPSIQLSTAGPFYPQLATFRGRLVAGYVDTRAANLGKFIVRVSDDDGATWSAEAYLFSGETFNATTFAPRLVASRDGQTLYFFNAPPGTIPQYRSTIDPTLATWTSPAAAGDTSMHIAEGNNCGNQVCQRAHTYSFMETATPGAWLYIASNGYQVGRGSQVGTLGGAWSLQFNHGGDGGVSGDGDSTATSFLDRDGAIIYVRAGASGVWLYYRRSTDGGLSWAPLISAYAATLPNYVTDAPVGLYVPNYTHGEYVWYAGFGGIENAMRVVPLWTEPKLFSESGTIRLFGSAGGDLDANSGYEYNFGNVVRSIGGGGYVTGATDLTIPGRLVDMAFTRTYNSAYSFDPGPLGPTWTHNFHWWLTDNGAKVTIRRSSGRQDKFTRQLDGTYTNEPGVFDTLVKTGDTAYTLTARDQTSYDFVNGRLVKVREPAGNNIALGYSSFNLVLIPQGGTASFSASRCCATGYEPDKAANGVKTHGGGAGVGWQVGAYLPGDWWKVTWSVAQSLSRVRLWDFHLSGDYYGQGHLEFSDSSTVSFGPLINNAGSLGEDFREISFPRKSGITWMKVVTDSLGSGWPGLAEVEAYDDESATPSFTSRLNVITDSVQRRIALGYAAEANLALGRTYQQSILPEGGSDTGGAELTDGQKGGASDYGDLSWQSHLNPAVPLEVTVDLGTAQSIGPVRSYYFHYPNDAVHRPASVEVLTSTDNINYTSRGSMLAADSAFDAALRWRYEVSANATARWVRLRIAKGGTWLVSSEIQVAPLGAVQPSATIGERLVSVTDPIGRKVRYGYDTAGRLNRVVDMLGNAAGQDPTLHTWLYAYDGTTNHISSITDPDGRVVVANTYDSLGRLDTQKDGLLNTTSFSYAAGQVTITDPRLHVTTQTFDARNRLLSQADTVDGIPYTLSYAYDGCGNLETSTDRNGKTTTYVYDCAGNLRSLEAPSLAPPDPGFVTTYDYDDRNNLKEVVDALGFVTTHDYDPVTNVLVKTEQQITKAPDPVTTAITKFEYTDATNPGLPTRIISPRGNTGGTPNYTYSQTLAYFATGELRERVDADGNKTTYTYDGVSRQLTTVDPDGWAVGGVPAEHTWTTNYDENDRVTAVIDPLGRSTLSSYDRAGNRTSATDRNGNVTTYVYDAAARLWKVQQRPDPILQPTLVYTTTVVRDGNGNATQVTQDKQGGGSTTVVTDYGYDKLNRLTSFTTHPGSPGPANLTTSYELDGNGNVKKRIAGDGLQTIYTYDNMSRLRKVESTGLSHAIDYDYDEVSQRVEMIDVTGTSTFEYDGLGRMTEAVQPNGSLTYGYDLDSNRTTLTYPGVGAVTYVPSPAGRLTSLTDWGSRQSAYTYTASGLAKTLTVPGGMTTTYGYDRAQRLTSLTNVTGSGTVSSHTYTLDNEGNRIALDETVSGITTAANLVAASVQVNTDAGTALQDHPAIALGPDGTYLIWDDARDGNANIYFSRRDAVTGAWSTPNTKVNMDTGSRIQLNPAIAVDSSSNAYAVWQDERNGAGKPDIYYRKRTAAGTWVSPDVKVNTDTGGGGGAVQRNVRIAGKGDGTQTAVWVDLRSNQNNIYSSTLSLAGSWLTPNPRVTDNTSATKDFPDVAVGPDGTSYAVWQDSRNGNPDIYFASLPPGGTDWLLTPNLKISDDPGTAAQRSPRIAVDGSGALTVVFLDDRVTPTQVRVVRRPAGGSWTSSVVATDAAARPLAPLALAVRADAVAQVAWSDNRAGANTDIYGSQYNGSVWSTSALLSDDPGTAAQSSPALAYVGGELASAWRDDRGGNGNSRARRTPGDHFAYSYDGLNRLTRVSLFNAESFALDGASNVTNRSGIVETYDAANRLTTDGGTTNVWTNADQLDLRGADNFDYDALDRLISSTVGGSARGYTYNGDGLLQSRTGAGATTFLWDPDSSPSRLVAQGADRIVYGHGPLYVVKADGTTSTLARDGGKSVRAQVTSAGAASASFRYKAYGQTAQTFGASTPTYLGYAGQLLDSSGLYYMRARWYEPMAGRFLTRDPLSSVASASSQNGFAYASSSPMNRFDPAGLRDTGNEDHGGLCGSQCVRDASARARPPGFLETLGRGALSALDWLVIGSGKSTLTDDGLEVVTNAGGLSWVLTTVFDAPAMTLSDRLIVTRDSSIDAATLQHERGHIAQAKDVGVLYLPTYVVLAPLGVINIVASQTYGRLAGTRVLDPSNPKDRHDAHLMEWNADFRANHVNIWSGQ